jgi:hypothetical protein
VRSQRQRSRDSRSRMLPTGSESLRGDISQLRVHKPHFRWREAENSLSQRR